MSDNPLITVFTPTYNRLYTLERTYKSLCSQTSKDFIWLIIDDGSTDGTKEVVKKWVELSGLNGFTIEYLYKKNGGMHTAHNAAYEHITTELNVCIDSDDYMPKDGVEKIEKYWKKHGTEDIAGIIALDADVDGKIIGTELPKHIKTSTTIEVYQKHHVKGDKKFIYRTSVINSVEHYPEFEGEKLVPLSYMYLQVDQDYEMLLMNEVVCIVDYQSDGSTNTIFKQYLQSPRGFAASNLMYMKYSNSLTDKIKSTIHYIAESRIAGNKCCLHDTPNRVLTALLYPLGIVAELYIYAKNKKNRRNKV